MIFGHYSRLFSGQEGVSGRNRTHTSHTNNQAHNPLDYQGTLDSLSLVEIIYEIMLQNRMTKNWPVSKYLASTIVSTSGTFFNDSEA